ncbi:hypothetical protein M758_3G016800 [Ceratodon purpureus]|uniref:Histone-lysine N-methyltransferase ATXR5 n=1 Tax=Ceratodon purpureus TaxID=3225 RepID=A0A8T0IET4_CERPU|nr:hypothetical protein KC19_3G016900 [Ceratodon purpureus]KAG0621395.1 hypothetical protein M758_3G016800 [Ceratodon purpureus]
MERPRYGKERRAKRVRISTLYRTHCSQVVECQWNDYPSPSPCKNTVDFAEEVLPTSAVAEPPKVEEPKTYVKKKQRIVKDEQVKVGTEMVIWTDPALIYSCTMCEECGRGDSADQMLLCDKCDRGFHMFCLSPILVSIPPGDWICPHCSQSTTAYEFQMVQRKIVEYFRFKKFVPSKTVMEGIEKRTLKKQKSSSSQKRGLRLLPYVPTIDLQRRLEQMASLAAALTNIGLDFSDSLSYGYAPRTANRAANEKGGMREMSKEDKVTLDRCKAMCKRGEWQPLMVTYDLRQGFVVEADEDIPNMTFIAEYTGEVDYMCCRHYDSGNSIMGLLFSDDPVKELVICPDRRGNIARFLSGINNHTEEGRSKQNVRCVRYSINGEARVILIAMRDIRKGERLYYDYNAYYTEYPTQHFV